MYEHEPSPCNIGGSVGIKLRVHVLNKRLVSLPPNRFSLLFADWNDRCSLVGLAGMKPLPVVAQQRALATVSHTNVHPASWLFQD